MGRSFLVSIVLWIVTSICIALFKQSDAGNDWFRGTEIFIGIILSFLVIYVPLMIIAALVSKLSKATWWIRGLIAGLISMGIAYVLLLVVNQGNDNDIAFAYIFCGTIAFIISSVYKGKNRQTEHEDPNRSR